jgi:hypothetical protein
VKDKYGPLRDGEIERARAWVRPWLLGANRPINQKPGQQS